MKKGSDKIKYPEKLINRINKNMRGLENAGLVNDSQFYQSALENALSDKYYRFKKTSDGVTVRTLTKKQWDKMTPKEQMKALKMYSGAGKATTATVKGTRQSMKKWAKTYMENNPQLFEDVSKAKTKREEYLINKINQQRANEHMEYFKNFWDLKKDHFAYDPEIWSQLMNNFDIDKMITSEVSPDRMIDFYNMVKRGRSDLIPRKYRGVKNYLV